MPRIGKITTPDNSSEIIGSAESDSEASSSTDINLGAGDEGKRNTTNNAAQDKIANEATHEHLLPGPARLLIGSFSALIAVASAVDLIYFGVQLNNPNSESRNFDSAFFTVGAVMTVASSACTILACVKPFRPNPQVPNA